ncbi:hypothetical protein E3N88_16148 [Mikania micrantha]|uniref:Uncharacterized protein n=1 Tax=Mikania micrantha TaxID=192012 RepID=A0A5N6NYW9_9ASTR|nr:hypothetical protein E3N88_16148 [Mikania micrantha]
MTDCDNSSGELEMSSGGELENEEKIELRFVDVCKESKEDQIFAVPSVNKRHGFAMDEKRKFQFEGKEACVAV